MSMIEALQQSMKTGDSANNEYRAATFLYSNVSQSYFFRLNASQMQRQDMLSLLKFPSQSETFMWFHWALTF